MDGVGGLRSHWLGYVGCLWTHLFMAVTMALLVARDIAVFVWSRFCGLRSLTCLWAGCVRSLWMHLFMAVPMTPSASTSDFSGWRYYRFLIAMSLFLTRGSLLFCTDSANIFYQLPSSLLRSGERWRRRQRHWQNSERVSLGAHSLRLPAVPAP